MPRKSDQKPAKGSEWEVWPIAVPPGAKSKWLAPDELVSRANEFVDSIFGKKNIAEVRAALRDPKNQKEYRFLRDQICGYPGRVKPVPWFQRHEILSEVKIDGWTEMLEIEQLADKVRRQVYRAFPPPPVRRRQTKRAQILDWSKGIASDTLKKWIVGILLAGTAGAAVWVKTGLRSAPPPSPPVVEEEKPSLRSESVLNHRRVNGRGVIGFKLMGGQLPVKGWSVSIDGKNRGDTVSDLNADSMLNVSLKKALPIGPHKFTFYNDHLTLDAQAVTLLMFDPKACVGRSVDAHTLDPNAPNGLVRLEKFGASVLKMPHGIEAQSNQSSVVTLKKDSMSTDLVLSIFSPHGQQVRIDYMKKTVCLVQGRDSQEIGVAESFWETSADRILCLSENSDRLHLMVLDDSISKTYATLVYQATKPPVRADKLLEVEDGAVSVGPVAIGSLSKAALNPANQVGR